VPGRGPGAGEKKQFRAPAQVVLAALQRPAQAKARIVLQALPVQPGVSVEALLAASGRLPLWAEPVTAAGQHAVGAIEEQLQRRHVAVLAYQDCRGMHQVSRQLLRHVSSPCTVVPCGNGFGRTQFI
jgi:hypothetical protein